MVPIHLIRCRFHQPSCRSYLPSAQNLPRNRPNAQMKTTTRKWRWLNRKWPMQKTLPHILNFIHQLYYRLLNFLLHLPQTLLHRDQMTRSFQPADEIWIFSPSSLSSDEVADAFNSIQHSVGETYHFRDGFNSNPSNGPEDIFNSFQKSVDSTFKWTVVASICKIQNQTEFPEIFEVEWCWY